MKKTLALVLVFAMVIPLALGACGKKKDDPKDATKAAPETTKSQETTTANSGDSSKNDSDEPDWDAWVGVVQDLVQRVNKLNTIDACGLQSDPSQTYTDENGFPYELVTDRDFQNVGDINVYLSDTFTVAAASYYYPYLFDPSSVTPPPYIYLQDNVSIVGLYEIAAGKGATQYKIQGVIEFTEFGEDHFTAEFDAEVLGVTEHVKMSVVQENGTWKVSAIDIV